jgi:hypothetical protein
MEHLSELRRLDPGRLEPVEGNGQRPFAKLARTSAAEKLSVSMLILGDVREMGEIAERSHDRDGWLYLKGVEHGLQRSTGFQVAVSSEPHRGMANVFDGSEDLLAFMVAHGVAQHAPEKADVLA